jgi:hypothetical protein
MVKARYLLIVHRSSVQRLALACSLLLLAPLVHAQATGFNFSMGLFHPIIRTVDDEKVRGVSIGMGLQRDMTDHIGFAVDGRYCPNESAGYKGTFELEYSSRYFVTSNEDAALYFGPFIAYQSVTVNAYNPNAQGGQGAYEEMKRKQFPIGLRAGVRGALNGFFFEGYGHIGHVIGNGAFTERIYTQPLYISLGISIGNGW